jgi:plasmid stabilization system protein ParE
MKIRILDRAEDDLIEGFRFYEKQEAGIGDYFLTSLASDIDSLRLYAGSHPTHLGHYYRLLSRRFPFAIYYTVNNDTALIHAVLDCRREPAWIRKRLRE